MAKNILSNKNQRPVTKTTLPSKTFNQDRRPRQNKSKRIQLHQTISARDATGTALRKGMKREREEHRYKKSAINKHLSIITLNINGLNVPINT